MHHLNLHEDSVLLHSQAEPVWLEGKGRDDSWKQTNKLLIKSTENIMFVIISDENFFLADQPIFLLQDF